MDALLPIARSAGLPIVEDTAQSIISTWHGRCTGAIGDVGCFSFYPTKNLGGMGDGGFLTTTRDDVAQKLSDLMTRAANVLASAKASSTVPNSPSRAVLPPPKGIGIRRSSSTVVHAAQLQDARRG
jgi:dTDP-4-amino-4,6-dideoxygalactose transaminase